MIATFGDDVNYTFNVDPVAGQLLDPKTLAPGIGDLTQEMLKRYKAETGAKEVPPHTDNNPYVEFSIALSKGTYIESIATVKKDLHKIIYQILKNKKM